MHPFFEGPKFAAFAHRGGALEGAENTLEAFEHAISLGYQYIETDVQLTADDVVVIFHDDDLTRLTDLEGRVRDHSWQTLSQTKVMGQGTIPRLEDALTAWPNLRLNIDAKVDDVALPLCQITKSFGVERLCLASESDRRIKQIREEMGTTYCTATASWETMWGVMPPLIGLGVGRTGGDCFQVPVSAYGIPAVTPRQISKAQAAGKPIHVWTIDDEATMEMLIDRGVDGIMTDRPTLLREVLKRRNLWD